MKITYNSHLIQESLKSEKEINKDLEKARHMKITDLTTELRPLYKNFKKEFESILTLRHIQSKPKQVYKPRVSKW